MPVAYRIVSVLKSGDEQTFTNYEGEQRTSKYKPVATVWVDEGGKHSVSFEKGLTLADLDKATRWHNFYDESAKRGGGNTGGARKPAARKASATRDVDGGDDNW